MPLADFMSLLRCGQARPTIYLYNHFDRSAIRAPQGTVAWPVEHLLTSYHKKHVFLPQMRPSIAEVNKAFALWSRKLLWRIYFDEHVVDDERERYRHLRSRRPLTAFCPHEPSIGRGQRVPECGSIRVAQFCPSEPLCTLPVLDISTCLPCCHANASREYLWLNHD